MWSSWLSSSSLPALEQTVSFAERRHALLAGNLANMDTPDYQTRDLSLSNFQAELRAAVSAPRKPASQYDASPASSEQDLSKVRDVSRQILYHDGSDVSLEEQVTEIAKNQMLHSTAIALMRSQMQILRAAIAESVNV
jgi:flagellar basal-body rod protein FlgB